MKKRDISGNRKKLCLHLQPIAAPLLPQSEEELKESIRCVLKALKDFHAKGWCHRDIRWANVLHSEEGWLLCDFEAANKSGKRITWSSKSNAPEILSGQPHTFATDVFQVGELMNDDRVISIVGGGIVFRSRLMNRDPMSRPTASTALGDLWLNVVNP